MWVSVLLLTCSLLGNVSTENDAVDTSSAVQWGWQMNQAGPGTVGHYFVKLPEAEQRVRYVADGSGYHGAVAVTTSDHGHIHTTNFALGDRALHLSSQTPPQIYDHQIISNGTQASPEINLQDGQTPLQIFLLRGQYPVQSHFLQVIPDNPAQLTPVPNFFLTNNQVATPSYYKLNLEHTRDDRLNTEIKQENQSNNRGTTENYEEIIETKENGPIIRVFKDHNCQNEDHSDNNNNFQNKNIDIKHKTTNFNNNEPTYKEYSIHGNFGDRNYKLPDNQRVSKNKIDRPDDRSERYYYSTEISHSTTSKPATFTEEEGISRLVASTQDLITNEDLLRINHAEERAIPGYGDDYIIPKRRLNSKTIVYNGPEQANPRSRITVTAKIGNIVDSRIEHPKTYREQSYETTNDYRFRSPIIVADPKYGSYKEQIVNNLVSTMVPYIQDGYEVVGVRNSLDENSTGKNEEKSSEDLVNITPRPISQKYLAPITVALRLLNSNNSEIYNTVDDHEASDSEFIEKTVENPENGKTLVEIQESIPVEITHINDVEYHEYLNEGRSNNGHPYGIVKSIYQKYLQNLESNKNAQNQYDGNPDSQKSNYYEINNNNEDSKETLESSENIQSEVQIQANSDNRNAYANYYAESNGKIIQPIIIEKQVPVTTYVDRFIEKKVPYPEPVEVVKQVPVDRPVPIPVRYETIVEKPVEVTKYVDKPYPVEVLQPYPVEVRVPYPVEHKVYVDRPVHVPYPVEKLIEKQFIHPVPIPTPVGIPIGIQVPVEKKVLYPVHIETPVPVAVPVEKPVTVEKIVEKEVPVPYPVEKQVPYPVRHEVKVPVPYPVEKRIPVPVEVRVPKPYPVDRIVEKKVPYPVTVERIVERKVHVKVPYPVKTFVEKIVEKPVVVTKYVDKPYPVEKRVPYPVEKIVERKVPYPVHIPVAVKVPYQVENKVQNPDIPYPFEQVEKPTVYTYGINHEVLSNAESYLRYNQEQYKQALPIYVQNSDSSTQQHAESQRNYQIQLANAQILRNIQNTTPVYSTQWGNQYAATYQYSNSTLAKKQPETAVNQGNSKYFGPLPLRNYNDQWEKNNDYTERLRRTDRTPKVTNLRIEYGGFKPPLIPSTEIDLDGLPINKSKENS